ncbi:hypothetical protein TYRP_000558 [Tyrophagus putrescentiae]|nr:hypothetical protein TYRP_000558 [Tyrophagus putrescentiae]
MTSLFSIFSSDSSSSKSSNNSAAASMDFKQWLNKNGTIVGDKSGAQVDIDVGGDRKVTVHASPKTALDEIFTLDDVRVRPIAAAGSKVAADQLISWQKDESRRRQVVGKLVAFLQETSKQLVASADHAALSKSKTALRVSALNSLASAESFEAFLPGSAYSLVLHSTTPSLLVLANQIVPYLLSGIPLTVVSNGQSAIHVAYLLDQLTAFGLPQGVVQQLVDFEVSGPIGSFVLLDSADIDSALDAALNSAVVYGVPSIKVFAVESAKSTVQEVLQHKLKIEYSGKLCLKCTLTQSTLKLLFAGIELHYFRSAPEALKLVNHLVAPAYRQQFVSVWSENSSLALKVASAVKSVKDVAVNGISLNGNGFSEGWKFELIEAKKLSQVVAANDALKSFVGVSPSKNWTSLSFSARVKILTSALDGVQVKSSAAVKFALSRSSSEIIESCTANKLYIAQYGPIGTIFLQLDDQSSGDEVATLAFSLNSLLLGNTLIVSGKSGSAHFATLKGN